MGLFDFFARDPDAQVRKHAARVADKRAQSPDRWESIHALRKLGNAAAVEGLLARFGFHIDPSITDEEERDAAFQGIVECGKVAIEPVRAHLRKSEAITWPLRILERLMTAEEVTEEILTLLRTFHTDYMRDPSKKVQVLACLEERSDPRIAGDVLRFIDDTSEDVRFGAVRVLFAQEALGEEIRVALAAKFPKEESVRVRAAMGAGFARRSWSLGEVTDALRKSIPAGFALGADGVPRETAKKP